MGLACVQALRLLVTDNNKYCVQFHLQRRLQFRSILCVQFFVDSRQNDHVFA
jgi:hypothetical protein